MIRTLLLPLLLLGAAGCERPAAGERAAYPALTGRVVDQADLLTAGQEAALSRKSEALEAEVGPQYVVVTIESLGGRPIEEFAAGLGRHWGLGHSDRDDGLLLLVAPAERKVRIAVGTGLERRVTDPFAAKVIDEQLLPRFRQNDFPTGIEAASDALIERLRSKASDSEIARADGAVT